MSERVETTYADLRPTDLVIDKAGNAWPIAELTGFGEASRFWLCDPVTKVKMHQMTKPDTDPVTVSRAPSHADDAAKLEAEFPESIFPESVHKQMAAAMGREFDYRILDPENKLGKHVEPAVASVEEILGGTVEAEVTAEEVDAASAATEDAPVHLPPFADMTPLERRSHLYLLHGVIAYDMKSNDELERMHIAAHVAHANGSLKSAHIPHVHEVA